MIVVFVVLVVCVAIVVFDKVVLVAVADLVVFVVKVYEVGENCTNI